jgi:hypothetical protein
MGAARITQYWWRFSEQCYKGFSGSDYSFTPSKAYPQKEVTGKI